MPRRCGVEVEVEVTVHCEECGGAFDSGECFYCEGCYEKLLDKKVGAEDDYSNLESDFENLQTEYEEAQREIDELRAQLDNAEPESPSGSWLHKVGRRFLR